MRQLFQLPLLACVRTFFGLEPHQHLRESRLCLRSQFRGLDLPRCRHHSSSVVLRHPNRSFTINGQYGGYNQSRGERSISNEPRYLTSVRNSEVVEVWKLGQQAKVRRERALFIAEGVRVVRTMLEAGWRPEMLYIREDTRDEVSVDLISFQDFGPVTYVTEQVLAKMSPAVTPSGILAVFPYPPSPQPKDLRGNGVVLAQISDPGNMGTLIRSASAFGVKNVVSVGGVDTWSPKVVQSTAGTIAHVRIFNWTWEQLHKAAAQLRASTCALVVSGGDSPSKVLSATSVGSAAAGEGSVEASAEGSADDKTLLLVVGNEAHGIPEDWVRECDHRITIPMQHDMVESLNAAVAGSLAMYLVFADSRKG